MTPEERAEKMNWHYPNGIPSSYLATQIREAERIASGHGYNQGYDNGFLAAREMAAKHIKDSMRTAKGNSTGNLIRGVCEALLIGISSLQPQDE